MITPDHIPAAIAIPTALTLWALWATLAILDIYRRTMTTKPRKLTVGQVADRFGVTVPTVRRWADDGLLKCTRTLGGDRRFDADYIDQKIGEA